LNLNGDISVLDEYNVSQPRNVLMGHQVAIEALAYCPETDKIFSSDRDGRQITWSRNDGKTTRFTGVAHKSRVFGLSVLDGNLISISVDDTVKVSSIATNAFHAGVKLPSQPTGVDAAGGWIAISTRDGVVLLSGDKIVADNKFSYGPTSVAVSSDGAQVAVGGADGKIHVYSNNGGKLAEKHTVEQRGQICCVAFSPNGALVAGGDTDRDVMVWEGTTRVSKDFGHSARVDRVRFSPDGEHLASASLDSSFIIWNIATAKRVAEMRNAHNGGVKDLVWVDSSSLVTTGQDILIKSWTFSK